MQHNFIQLNPFLFPPWPISRIGLCVVLGALLAVSSAFAQPRDATIINTELEPEYVRIVSITDENVYVSLGSGRSRPKPLDHCIAIRFAGTDASVRTEGDTDQSTQRGDDNSTAETGRLLLADGQHYIGRLVKDADLPDDVVAWSHPLLGRLEFQLDEVRSMTLPGAPTSSRTEPDLADVVELRNGDQLHGFVMSINDPIEIELMGSDGNGAGRIIELPMDRVASVSMIAPKRAAEGQRVWLTDGTIMAIESVSMPEEGELDVTGRWHGTGTRTVTLPRGSIAAMLLDARRVTPLSSITPTRVDGPPTRYRVTGPVLLDDSPLLGASRIEYRGPVTVHYALPTGTKRFAAHAVLPRQSRTWGDFELSIRVDGREVERRTINAADPSESINIAVDGSELTIELIEGESGPVQNHLILSQALVLLEE